ncbi:hypothetical protein ASB57_28830 [Bordetella sp. N]|nr:hypothetical protein ASB57_28830 [Bordetella sp. N]
MEIRVARLEVIAEHTQRDISELKTDVRELRKETKAEIGALRTEVRTDFRVMFGALITVALGLAGLMAKGFGWY